MLLDLGADVIYVDTAHFHLYTKIFLEVDLGFVMLNDNCGGVATNCKDNLFCLE